MALFKYTARDQTGRVFTGSVAAGSIADLRENLRQKDQYLTSAKESAQKVQTAQAPLFRRRKPKLGDLVVMSRQFATLFRAGLSIPESLNTASSQCESPALGEALQAVRLDVMTGSTLTDAMRKHPKMFNPMMISLVQAGEVGGVLDSTLETIADQFDKQADLNEKVKSAFIYPVIVLLASLGSVAFMLVFIVPVFAKLYSQFHAELPAITRLLVTMSDVLVHRWWLVGAIVAGVVWSAKRFNTTDTGHHFFDRLKLRIPVLGVLLRKIAVARFTQTLAGTMKAGVAILSALAISAETAGNVIIFDAVMRAASAIKEGSDVAGPLEQTGEFPPMVTRMVAAGEQSGDIVQMLDEITRFYHRDIEYGVGKLTRMIEPLMTMVVGGIVMFILLALYMPVFNLSHVVRAK